MSARNAQQIFDQIADRYDRHAALEQEVCSRLLERLTFQRREPERLVDLGCGTGEACAQLRKNFRKARVIGIDISGGMLREARKRAGRLRPFRSVCADMNNLPLVPNSVDLVFSNLSLHWSSDPKRVFEEVRRVLRPDGLWLFSALGPASLQPLKAIQASAQAPREPAVFPDLLELGDAMMAAGFREPVMDTEQITLSYRSPAALVDELEATGSAALLQARSDDPQPSPGATYPLVYEIYYGLAFGPEEGQPQRSGEGEVATFSVEALRKKIRNRD